MGGRLDVHILWKASLTFLPVELCPRFSGWGSKVASSSNTAVLAGRGGRVWTCSISTNRELARNTNSWLHPDPKSETGIGPEKLSQELECGPGCRV